MRVEKLEGEEWETVKVQLIFIFIFLSLLFRAAPAACGRSQARGGIRAVAASYTTATAMPDPSCVCDLHHSSRQCWILNPLSEARDRTRILTGPRGPITAKT